jgi:hypothetical protein
MTHSRRRDEKLLRGGLETQARGGDLESLEEFQ